MTTQRDATTRQSDAPAADRASATRLFDIRRIIGGLFLLYGVVLLVAGLVDPAAAEEKAAGIDINAWTGAAMAVFGLAFLAWMRLRPLRVDPGPDRQEPTAGARDERVLAEDHGPRRS